MSFAEVMLRVGCSLVGYLVLFAHCLWLAAMVRVPCGSDADASWLSLLMLIPLTLGCLALVRVGRVIPGLADALRIPAYPLALLIAVAAFALWPVLTAHTLGGAPICGLPEAASWHPYFAPAQYLTLGAMVWLVVTMFREPDSEA